ncbi:hypothetical protein IWX90DRAFT_213439 [Phyllosticta citrichinensis]|uniref:Uncharacterized protein n=1 Tax=Phyllosticta citrichinensis TaxID=1130410 RepID=A0ABR1XTD2_9PEZI
MAYDAHSNYQPPPRHYYPQGPPQNQAYYGNSHHDDYAQDQAGYAYDDGYAYQDGYGYAEDQYNGYNGGYGHQQGPPPPRQMGPPGGYGMVNGGLPPQSHNGPMPRGPPPQRGRMPPRGPPPGPGPGPGPGPRGYGPPPSAGARPPVRGDGRGRPPPQNFGPGGDPMGRGRPPPQGAPPNAPIPNGAPRPKPGRAASPQALPFDSPFPVFPTKTPPRTRNRPMEEGMANMTMNGRPGDDPSRQGPRKMSKSSESGRPPLNDQHRTPPYQQTPRSRAGGPGSGAQQNGFDQPSPPIRAHTAGPVDNHIGGFRMPAFGSPETPPQVQRSATMPQNYQQALDYDHEDAWNEPVPPIPAVPQLNAQAGAAIPRPRTAGDRRQQPQIAHVGAMAYKTAYQPPKFQHGQHPSEGGYGAHSHVDREAAIEAEMPDFDSIPQEPMHRRGQSFERHLGDSGSNTPVNPSQPPPEFPMTNGTQQVHRSKSQPDFNRGQRPNGYTAERSDEVPALPQLPRSNTVQEYGHGAYFQSPPPPRPNTANGRGPFPPGPQSGSQGSGYRGPPPAGPLPRLPPTARPGNRFYGQPAPGPMGRPSLEQQQYNSDPGPHGMRQGPPQAPLPDHRARGPPRAPNNVMSPGGASNPMSPGSGSNIMSPVEERKSQSEDALPHHPTPASHADSLPHHPAPVRPGHMGQKPAPVRNYSGGNVPQAVPTIAQPQPPKKSGRRYSDPLTLESLARLRQEVQNHPRNDALHLKYAKKLVDAASVLANEGGRADPKTTAKNRERYIQEAYKSVKKLVQREYTEAMFYLADSYGQGSLGLNVDEKEAFGLYMQAAKLGHAPSAYRTAVCCEIGAEEGGGTRKDPMKAMQWYKRAAALGDVAAMYKLGMVLLKGLMGQQKNVSEAITWLKRAADRADEENPHALHELALLYCNKAAANAQHVPDHLIGNDDAQAYSLFKRAADMGYKFSQFRLGEAYEYGLLGCPIDQRSSIAWYTKAAAQGEHQAELALSGWYLTGSQGILDQSDTEAYLWARKAACADPPLPKAMFAMGYFTEVGIGCPRSLDEAKRWYGRAASHKFPKAQERLEELKRGGVRAQRSRERLSRSNHKQHEENCIVM